ncbi:AsnC family transcriptional regulator [Streptomyces varsoviensis]|uniref:AsnC family transcriptional regulator n=1 Tax=Streptomyces varsoviensis TaxID=67373 RepID=A0ABR5J101_9ACTN|nr:AsnC family transcriptional regulator [Streptomyces varsoviensis]
MRHSLDETDRRITAVLLASPRASWRTVAACLGISERTVVRRAAPLFQDGTLRATAVRSPAHFTGLVPMALRVRCRPQRIRAVAATLARRQDTVWVDVMGGGDEICTIVFLAGPDARNALLLRDLPATAAVDSWTAHSLMRVHPASLRWTAGLLTPEQLALLSPGPVTTAVREAAPVPADTPVPVDTPVTAGTPVTAVDDALVEALAADGRATYGELGHRAGVSALTARRRLDALVRDGAVRPATEVDLALLGVHAEALLWITVTPGGLEETARALSDHPQVRFAAATTGPANLLVAVAAADLDALYAFLTTTVGALERITGIETVPILSTVKRTGIIRRSPHSAW